MRPWPAASEWLLTCVSRPPTRHWWVLVEGEPHTGTDCVEKRKPFPAVRLLHLPQTEHRVGAAWSLSPGTGDVSFHYLWAHSHSVCILTALCRLRSL